MKPAFTFDEIRTVEKTVIEQDGIPSLLLMENAGRNAFDVIVNKIPALSDYNIYIFCGKGNNAGDGFVIARQMALNGLEVNIINTAGTSELKGDALINFDVLKKMNSELVTFTELSGIKGSAFGKGKILIIDAILGSGVKGNLSEDFRKAISFINKSKLNNKKLLVVSVDVPSGLMSGESRSGGIIFADHTITMGVLKTELLYGEGKENSGEITVVPIGIKKGLLEKHNVYKKYVTELEDIKKVFPRRKKASYKYSNGKVLIIGGSRGLSGAVIMSSLSALKSGAGAVFAAIPESIAVQFGKKLYEVIKTELDETEDGSISKNSFDKIKKRIDNADAVLIGPGISLNPETKEFLFDVIKKCSKNLIIDADGLSLLAEDTSVLLKRESTGGIILTPHLGEFSGLCKTDAKDIIMNRFETVREFASGYNVNIVMKSETTFSCLKDGYIYINSTGNESLASAGSGDVLSGILVSMLAQTGDVYSSVVCGNYLHGMIAEIYYQKYGNKQSAAQQDLIKYIPEAITNILN